MELKRYVMLNNNVILKVKNVVNGKHEDGRNYYLLYVISDGYNGPHYISEETIKATSDNIIDLVEVGDLVETKQNGVLEIIGENFYVRTGVNLYLIDIVAIYKRQSNGDYKRYEVLS